MKNSSVFPCAFWIVQKEYCLGRIPNGQPKCSIVFPAAASGGGTGGPGNTSGKSVGEDDDGGLPIVPIAAGLVALLIAKKLFDIYFELRGDPESPKDVNLGMVLAGFGSWLISPFSSKKEAVKEVPKEESSDKRGYIVAGSLFLVAVALLKIIVGGEDGEGAPDGADVQAAVDAGKSAASNAVNSAANIASSSSKAWI